MPERFDDLPVLAGLGTSLRAAMAQAEAAAVADEQQRAIDSLRARVSR